MLGIKQPKFFWKESSSYGSSETWPDVNPPHLAGGLSGWVWRRFVWPQSAWRFHACALAKQREDGCEQPSDSHDHHHSAKWFQWKRYSLRDWFADRRDGGLLSEPGHQHHHPDLDEQPHGGYRQERPDHHWRVGERCEYGYVDPYH